jgi:hypothetical protein
LKARELPPTSGFTTPHAQAYAGAQFLCQELENWNARIHELIRVADGDITAITEAELSGALERQALSEAVQVMCAMTIEGAVNLLGVMVLGEQQFLDEFEAMGRQKGLLTKLKALVRLVRGTELKETEELFAAAQRLAAARNDFVHPKAQEGSPTWNRSSSRRSDLQSARAAIADVHRFFDALRALDPRYTLFFFLFPTN